MKRLASHLMVAAGLLSAPAVAQSPLIGQAIAAGQVGERYDGYMGFAANPSPELQRRVAAVNIRRRNLYIELATQRNVTPQLVGMATACQLLSRLAVGEPYMLSDGVWRRHGAGEPEPVPSNCH